ncbi:MAG: hypothetical protein Kow00124_17890 [Anaerolineae bacterium]
MLTPQGYHDLIEAFGAPGCAICQVTGRMVTRHIEALLYEYVNDIDTQAAFRAARGLCSEHAAQAAALRGYVLGVAILYRASVDEALHILAAARTKGAGEGVLARLLRRDAQPGPALAAALEPSGECPACVFMAEVEDRFAGILAERLDDDRLLAAYRSSDGLCLPHFRLVLGMVRDAADVGRLVDLQTAIWAHLHEGLTTFIEKYDHNHRAPMGDESDSPRRAIQALAGDREVFGLRCRR